MGILPDPFQEARRIIGEAEAAGLTLRLLGGLAVWHHSPSASHRALSRAYPDLDFALGERRSDRAEALLSGMGYAAHKAFNLLNGDRRILFSDETHGRQIDVFIGGFRMCHSIPLLERLPLERITIPLAELLLTKLQIVEMNPKDLRDVAALLLDHPLGEGDAETINLAVIAALCAEDWGLWKTVGLNLDRAEQHFQELALEAPAKSTLRDRIGALRRTLEEAPKSVRWRLRARVGERVPWYELPEEVRRGQE
jgi:hypothetical protein